MAFGSSGVSGIAVSLPLRASEFDTMAVLCFKSGDRDKPLPWLGVFLDAG
jgi:hypothetical protein